MTLLKYTVDNSDDWQLCFTSLKQGNSISLPYVKENIVYWGWEGYKTVGESISRERKNTLTQKKKIILNE